MGPFPFESAIAGLRDLPWPGQGLLIVFGLGLVFAGRFWQRFWLTSVAALAAGLVGMTFGQNWGLPQPLTAGLVLALLVGGLAAAMLRPLVFAIAAGLSWWLSQGFFADTGLIPLAIALVVGLASQILLQTCLLMVSAAAGVVLLGHLALACGSSQEPSFLAQWWQARPTLALTLVGLGWLLGVLFQLGLGRKSTRKKPGPANH